MRWDLFCRVVDNYGDIGVCWRLAVDLAQRGEQVRLWADDLSALAWMAPDGAAGVDARPWDDAAAQAEPGEVVVEAFGCEVPAGFVARMAARDRAPVWLNLEYLSAEPWVARCHGLPSPQLSGPGSGLTKWFFYPGFEAGTGGLIREAGLMERRRAFDARAWRAGLGLEPAPGERCVSLFCYPAAPVEALLRWLGAQPTLLLLTQGPARRPAHEALGRGGVSNVRTVDLPWLTQTDFDHLLWACDLNFVRGEDSAVRALWAGQPFVWQFYPQADGAHAAKLEAFLDRYLDRAGDALARPLRILWRAWNGLGPWPARTPVPSGWFEHSRRWRDAQSLEADLGTQLLAFVRQKS